jgi:hypothetical protein
MSISFVRQADTNNPSSATNAVTMGGAVAVGDLLVAQLGIITADGQSFPAVVDSVNAGSWNLPSALNYYTTQNQFGGFTQIVEAWIECDTAGTPTISVSGLGAGTASVLSVSQYTGFVHSPSLVTADVTTNQGTSTSPSATGLTNTVANELTTLFASCQGGQNFASVTGNFTARNTSQANAYIGDKINSTSGNALSFGAAITSNSWAVMLASFQDVATVALQVSSLSSMSLGPG